MIVFFLTHQNSSAILLTAGTPSAGPEKPGFVLAKKSPQSLAAFLCLSFSTALRRLHSVMAGCFGQRSALAGSNTRFFSVPLQPVAQCPEKVSAAVQLICIGATAMNTQATGKFRPESTQQPEAVNDFFRQMAELETERQAATEAGLPALERLAKVAERDTGQAGTVRLFLLGLWNGYRFPFNLITLRGLDKSLFDDCMAVLTLDARATAKEVHLYLDDGGELFERWARLAGGEK